jgi:hypothetical protein
MDQIEWICRANKNSNNQIVWKCFIQNTQQDLKEHFESTITIGSTVKLPGNNPLGILFPGDSGTVTQVSGQNILVVNPQVPNLMYWYNISDFAVPVVAPPVVAPTVYLPSPSSPPPPFIVTQMTGAQLWLDSKEQAAIVLSGSNVSQWNDKSINFNNFTVQSNFNPPTYIDINSGVQFNSNQVMISTKPITTNSNTNIFFVGNVLNNKDDFDYIAGFTQQDLSFRWNPRNNFGDNGRNDFATNSNYIVDATGSTTDAKKFINKSLVNFTVQNAGSGKLTLSTDINSWGDRFFKGTIYELLIFNSPLTSAQTQQIQMYLLSKWNLPGIASGYTCPPGMNQTPEDLQNGSCLAPCNSTKGGSNTYNYGPKYGGFPTNRRSGADRCADLGNGSDQTKAFAARTANWPPVTGGDPSCFVNGQYNANGMKLYTQNDCEAVVGGNWYPTSDAPGYGECLYPEGGSHSYTCRRGQ